MKRREFIAGLGSAAAFPPAASAQPTVPVIGLLSSLSPETVTKAVAAIFQGLKDQGFIEGQGLKTEQRWADGHYDRLPAMATDLVDQKVAAIVTIGGNAAAGAAKAATTTIPIVFATSDDPVATGLVTNFVRPTGNMTGVTWMGVDLLAKDFDLLHELLPNVPVFGVLLNPDRADNAVQLKIAQDAANKLGRKIRALSVRDPGDIDAAFATIVKEHIGGLIVSTDPLFNVQRERIITLAAEHATPTLYFLPEFASSGGLMSYGSSLIEAYHQAGIYAGLILKGARPTDLPIQQTTKVEFVINLKTANALGLTIPLPLLGRADEVIE
ncbi:MAG: ABC transporter substrate-binding protein [Xanthobacteraceae bacterium]